jgi:hypothetical protein
MLSDETNKIKIKIIFKKGPKIEWSQPNLIFKTRDTNHEVGLQHERQTQKNNNVKFPTNQNN